MSCIALCVTLLEVGYLFKKNYLFPLFPKVIVPGSKQRNVNDELAQDTGTEVL